MRFTRPAAKAASPQDENAESVARVRAELEAVAAQHGGPTAMVSVAQVLDLINPRGGWRYVPGHGRLHGAPAPDPLADPMTGCMPVTAKTDS